MHGRFRIFAERLAGCESGNAMIITALALPILIGGAGFGVDLSQWYMWKREVQFAVDQAAIAAAYTYSDDATRDTYTTRASQEFSANLTAIDGIAGTPVIGLVDYDGGTDNAISVSASVSAALPFTSMFMETPASIYAEAWAIWEGGSGEAPATQCIIALDPSGAKAVRFNGGPTVNAGCGVASLSTDTKSVWVDGGSSPIELGSIYAAGGIDSYFDSAPNTAVAAYYGGLTNPFEGLTPPDNPTARTFECPSSSGGGSSGSSASYTITYDTQTLVEDLYYEGNNKNNMSLQSTTQVSNTPGTATETGSSSAEVGDTDSSDTTAPGTAAQYGSGRNKYWARTDRRTTINRTVTSVVDNNAGTEEEDEDAGDMLQPGTYSDFDISCDVTLASGIYVIDGGDFSINAGDSITGNGVMFVLKNGAGIKVNGGGSVNLTAMDTTQLIAAGVSAADADELEGMLFFEDPESSGTSNWNKINGNSSTYLNGTVYLPVSDIEITGTASVSSRCLTIAAYQVQFGGTADISTFCPPNVTSDVSAISENGGGTAIRLVR